MHVVIVANDTQGGVQPYLALGVGLKDAGHDVRMVAPENAAASIHAARLPYASLSGDVEAFIRSSQAVAERGTLNAMRVARREMRSRIVGWTEETLDAARGADVLTGGVGGMVTGVAVADRLRVPFVEAHVQPVGAPSASYPGPLFASVPRWAGPIGRRASHTLSELAMWLPFRDGIKTSRRALGIGATSTATAGQPVLYGFSHRVVAVPKSAARPRHVTGWWFHDAPRDWAMPPELEASLSGSGPVVSVGFGSMAATDPGETGRLVIDAARLAAVRIVLLSGWSGLDVRDERVLVMPSVPHDRLFPRVAAIVHHGGAGTTGAALRAGVPSIVVPFAVDQPFWGSRVAALGVGPAPIPRKKLTAKALASAIGWALGDAGMRRRAAELGEHLRAEDGVAAAVGVFARLPKAR
ncbi:MAG TPA: glycosyltransferase [Candidatus Limnocylindrales bacterium]|nr:glycosyltransferase [Candidatus Limnocylindrales bacterium]